MSKRRREWTHFWSTFLSFDRWSQWVFCFPWRLKPHFKSWIFKIQFFVLFLLPLFSLLIIACYVVIVVVGAMMDGWHWHRHRQTLSSQCKSMPRNWGNHIARWPTQRRCHKQMSEQCSSDWLVQVMWLVLTNESALFQRIIATLHKFFMTLAPFGHFPFPYEDPQHTKIS